VEALEDRWCPTGGNMEWDDPLDPTFGAGGVVLNNPGSGQGLTDVVALPSGKILAAGHVNGDFAAARYNADGSFDTSFGNGGLTTVDFKGVNDEANAIAVLPNGKILLAGTTTVSSGQAIAFGVVRLNPNGTLDTTFGDKGSKGKVAVSPAPRTSGSVESMAVLPDGRFVLAGMASGSSIALARFNAGGTLDTSFGNNGTVLTTIAARSGYFAPSHDVNVAVDGNGRIVVSANTVYPNYDFLVARFNSNGSLDTTFGAAHTGVVTTDLASGSNDQAYALALQSDGKIVVAGTAIPNASTLVAAPLAVVRYNPDGSLDTTFDQDGIVTDVWDVGPARISSAIGKAVLVQPDGKILIAADGSRVTPAADGNVYSENGFMLLMRFNPDGSPDLSYGPTGTRAVATSFGYGTHIAAMDVQLDGRVVVVGRVFTEQSVTNPNPLDYFALARFFGPTASPSPVQIGSLTASPATVAAGSPLTLTAGGITSANAGATITKVAFYAVDSSGAEQFLGYGTQNADGTWTLAITVTLRPDSYTLLAVAVDSTGAVSDPIFLDLEVL
jgi:uncharacterized delta-60 repeat protein